MTSLGDSEAAEAARFCLLVFTPLKVAIRQLELNLKYFKRTNR